MRYQYTWTLRWHCMLNCLWVVTVIAKRMLTNAFFFFVFSTERFMLSLTRDHISKNQYVRIISGYWFSRESWVIRTLLLSQGIESHMATRVPSPIISMTERTALCPPTDSTRKQSTRVWQGNKWIPGLCTWWLGSFFKRSNSEVISHERPLILKEYYRAAQDIGLLTIAVK